MREIQQLGYMGFEVSDLGAWEQFATGILGMTLGRRQKDGGFSLRIDDYKQRFFVTPGLADDLAYVGLEVAGPAEMQAVADRVRAAGVAVTPASDTEAVARDVAGYVWFKEPGGVRFEVYYGGQKTAEPLSTKVVEKGFKTGDLGLGHFVLRANDLEETLKFVLDVLGFRLSDRIICDIGGYKVNIAFTHCNPRHHSLAVGERLPKHIHHFMLEVNEIDDVGKCWDRVVNAGLTVWNAIGRHPNDRMLSFYAETPSKFQFEFGWGGREILNDDEWQTYVYDRISDWGHEHPGAMFKKLFRKQKAA